MFCATFSLSHLPEPLLWLLFRKIFFGERKGCAGSHQKKKFLHNSLIVGHEILCFLLLPIKARWSIAPTVSLFFCIFPFFQIVLQQIERSNMSNQLQVSYFWECQNLFGMEIYKLTRANYTIKFYNLTWSTAVTNQIRVIQRQLKRTIRLQSDELVPSSMSLWRYGKAVSHIKYCRIQVCAVPLSQWIYCRSNSFTYVMSDANYCSTIESA